MNTREYSRFCIVIGILMTLIIGCYFTQISHTDTDETLYQEDYDISFSESELIEEPIVSNMEYVTIPSTVMDISKTLESVGEATEATETTEIEPAISEEDIELLACAIYQEAGSDYICDDCRRRVGDIILNRVADENFPNTIEEVLTREGQYGNYYWTGVVWPKRASYSCEIHAVERARNIAREILEGNHSEVYGNGYIWQAGFEQGSDGFWCCGIYFGRS